MHTAMLLLALFQFTPTPDSTLAQRIEAFIQPYVQEGYWSGSVLVARADSIVYSRGHGLADAEHVAANRPDTRFPVASVTKAFTRIAAERLMMAGVMRPEDQVSHFLPTFPRGDDITVRQIIGHRSGIIDSDDLEWFPQGQKIRHGIHALVDSLGKEPLVFEPGSRYGYSNGGYTVLARILEIATDLEYEELIQEWVFEPAGMTRSGNWSGQTIIADLAEGYTIGEDGELAPGPFVHPSNKIGAGSAYATVEDVWAFYRALRDDRLMPSSKRDSVLTLSESAFGRPRMYLGGRGPGYTASVQAFFGDDVLVVVLGNNYSRLNEEISDGVTALVFGEWQDPRIEEILERRLPFDAVPRSPGELRAMEGDYQHAWGFTFTLEETGGRLVYIDPEHGTRTPLIPTREGVFVSPWQWAEISFEPEGIHWTWLDFPGRNWIVEKVR